METNKQLKVIHIIPAAFEYFNDIKESALKLVFNERKFGVDAEAATLQYGPDTRQEKERIQTGLGDLVGPTGFFNIRSVVDDLSKFDIIHLHTPCFGFGNVWKWIKIHPEVKICVSFYRSVEKHDLFGGFVSLYNFWLLPKIFDRADLLVMNDKQKFIEAFGDKYFNKKYILSDVSEAMSDLQRSNIHLTKGMDGVKLSMEESRALAYFNFYNYLLK